MQNASLAMTELGGSNYRYLGLALSKIKYQEIIGNTFVSYPNPGRIPVKGCKVPLEQNKLKIRLILQRVS